MSCIQKIFRKYRHILCMTPGRRGVGGGEALQKVFKVIFCLFHEVSAMEYEFNADDLFTVENQSELSLKTCCTKNEVFH